MSRATFIPFERVVWAKERLEVFILNQTPVAVSIISVASNAFHFWMQCSRVPTSWILPKVVFTFTIMSLIGASTTAQAISHGCSAATVLGLLSLAWFLIVKTYSLLVSSTILTGLKMIGGNQAGSWIDVFDYRAVNAVLKLISATRIGNTTIQNGFRSRPIFMWRPKTTLISKGALNAEQMLLVLTSKIDGASKVKKVPSLMRQGSVPVFKLAIDWIHKPLSREIPLLY